MHNTRTMLIGSSAPITSAIHTSQSHTHGRAACTIIPWKGCSIQVIQALKYMF